MSRPWMPLYVADYLADTGHLSAAEHGAYLLLIMHYWANGGLPCDDKKLARIARMSDKEWKAARETVAEFFSPEWKHDRIERELAEANAAYERRAMAGRKGGKAGPKPKPGGSNEEALLKQSQPQSPNLTEPNGSAAVSAPPPDLKNLCEEAAGRSYPQGFGAIVDLVESGVSVEARILPVIRDVEAFLRKQGRSVDSWAFHAKAISDPHRETKKEPEPVVWCEAGTPMFDAGNRARAARGEKPVRPLPSKHHDGKGAYFAKADLSFDAAIADRALSPHAGAAA